MLDYLAAFVAALMGSGLGWHLSTPGGTRWSGRLGVLLTMVGVAAGFWVVLTLGFRWNGQSAPEELDSGLLPAVVVLAVAMTIGVRHAWQGWRTSIGNLSMPVDLSGRVNAMAERKIWLAAMAADPLRSRYAAMIAAGDSFWTPMRIEYDLDEKATTCCQHLAPIESAMRIADIQVRLDGLHSVRAECLIDSDALSRRFPDADSIAYEELHAYDRSLEDPPQARLLCSLCGSVAWVQHPRVAASGTPSFPTGSN